MMRIAYLQNTPTTRIGAGAAVHVAQVANRLLARGHTLFSNLQGEGDHLLQLAAADWPARGREIDAYYVRIHGTKSNDRFTLARRANPQAPCVWEVNAPLDERRLSGVGGLRLWRHKRRRRMLARLVTGAICISDEMQDYARRELEIANTVVVPNGSDPDVFSPARRDPSLYPEGKLVVIWAGSSEYPWQGLPLVEELASHLAAEPDLHFVVTAAGRSRANLTYLGALPYHAMPVHLASADIGLCVYQPITFYPRFYFSPLKLYDYMASGLAVIGTQAGQVGDVLRTERCGLTTDGSLADVSAKLQQLNVQRRSIAELGARGRAAVVRHYHWDRVVDQIEQFLQSLLARR
ncbi:MAG: glycosyltransferase [Planctomycetota bacterium]